MCPSAQGPIILSMTRPATSSKAQLPADRSAESVRPDPEPAPLRRYRISRLRLDSRLQGGGARFEYLKNVYD
jgi:hypothetical protein